jgi:hypothetical protein
VLRRAIVLCPEIRSIVFLKIANGVAQTTKAVQYGVKHGRRPRSMVESMGQRRTGRTFRARLEEQSHCGAGMQQDFRIITRWPENGCTLRALPGVETTGTKNAGAH